MSVSALLNLYFIMARNFLRGLFRYFFLNYFLIVLILVIHDFRYVLIFTLRNFYIFFKNNLSGSFIFNLWILRFLVAFLLSGCPRKVN